MSHYEPLAKYMRRFNHPFARRDLRQVNISRRFSDERGEEDDFGSRTYQRLVEYLSRPLGNVLDVGSGFGAGAVEVSRLGAQTVLGISNSAFQIETSRAVASSARVTGCTFILHDFDEPLPEETFNTILSVESLVHSKTLDQTVKSLARSLAKSGQMAILEDVCIDPPSNFDRRLLRLGWSVDHIPRRNDYLDAFRDTHLTVIREIDLTADLSLNSPAIARVIMYTCTALSAMVPIRKLRILLRFHAAQSLLHLRLQQGHWKYIAFILE